jgi:hypothetical protein
MVGEDETDESSQQKQKRGERVRQVISETWLCGAVPLQIM